MSGLRRRPVRCLVVLGVVVVALVSVTQDLASVSPDMAAGKGPAPAPGQRKSYRLPLAAVLVVAAVCGWQRCRGNAFAGPAVGSVATGGKAFAGQQAGQLRGSTQAAATAAVAEAPPLQQRMKSRLHQVGTLAIFVGLEKYLARPFGAAINSPLPPSLLGMFGLFTALLAVERVAGTEASDRMFKALEPGYRTLVKWGSCFFVPALMALPVAVLANAHVFDSSMVVVKLLAFIVIAYTGSLKVIGSLAAILEDKFAPGHKEDTPAPTPTSAAAAAAAAPAAPAKPAPKPYDPEWLKVYGAAMGASIAAFFLSPAGSAWRQASETVFMLASVFGGLVLGQNLPGDWPKKVHPVLTTIAVGTAAAFTWSACSGASYLQVLAAFKGPLGAGGLVLLPLLQPLVACFGMSLYERRKVLRDEFVPILGSSAIGSIVCLFGAAILARPILRLPVVIAGSTVSFSATAPLALAISEMLGDVANPDFTTAFVLVMGLIGAAQGLALMKRFSFKSPMQRGVSMGVVSTGLGTVSLAREDAEAFTYAAVTLALCGSFSTAWVAIPAVRNLLISILTVGA
eukprot:TRINITY_DN111988_c0_g1_i1.p1 TRINITY_DN111988_c0_g1~~TRINITY_DN111988_c0_g1_i1.p1  ORF type:complete len:569 (+),score=107.87 TRINITY_DN111988_c0_g1_i1:24-1730(+)